MRFLLSFPLSFWSLFFKWEQDEFYDEVGALPSDLLDRRETSEVRSKHQYSPTPWLQVKVYFLKRIKKSNMPADPREIVARSKQAPVLTNPLAAAMDFFFRKQKQPLR